MKSPRLCSACRAEAETPEGRARSLRELTERNAYQVDGAPWWLCSRPEVVVRYQNFEQLEREHPIATENGWEIASSDTVGGHIRGGAVFAVGLAGLMVRTQDTVTITWRRGGTKTDAPAEDPVATLQKLKSMRDLDLITAAEYETKKAEILARM